MNHAPLRVRSFSFFPSDDFANTYFKPVLLHEKFGDKTVSTGDSGPMAKLCNAAPAFFVRNLKERWNGTNFLYVRQALIKGLVVMDSWHSF